MVYNKMQYVEKSVEAYNKEFHSTMFTVINSQTIGYKKCRETLNTTLASGN
jgi:hypothetical protein